MHDRPYNAGERRGPALGEPVGIQHICSVLSSTFNARSTQGLGFSLKRSCRFALLRQQVPLALIRLPCLPTY